MNMVSIHNILNDVLSFNFFSLFDHLHDVVCDHNASRPLPTTIMFDQMRDELRNHVWL
jgi:hypothetical protein